MFVISASRAYFSILSLIKYSDINWEVEYNYTEPSFAVLWCVVAERGLFLNKP